MTQIAVGSANPVKVSATEAAVDCPGAAVVSVPVESGVSDQPVGRDETIRGAENRASRALAADDGADYGVGLEGGVADFDGRPGLSLVMWAAVADGHRLERGGGPTLRLPDDVAERVLAGEELGPVMDDLLDTEGVSERRGAAGVLTGGAIDRESALAHAVAGAFAPFRTEYY